MAPADNGDRRKAGACRFFAQGKCRDGDKCRFSHDPPVKPRSRPCHNYFQQGSCRFGDRCNFSHDPAAVPGGSQRPPPPPPPKRKNGPSCKPNMQADPRVTYGRLTKVGAASAANLRNRQGSALESRRDVQHCRQWLCVALECIKLDANVVLRDVLEPASSTRGAVKELCCSLSAPSSWYQGLAREASHKVRECQNHTSGCLMLCIGADMCTRVLPPPSCPLGRAQLLTMGMLPSAHATNMMHCCVTCSNSCPKLTFCVTPLACEPGEGEPSGALYLELFGLLLGLGLSVFHP